jgi:IS30 family transposase
MIDLIKSKLQIEWSPEQISGWLLDEKVQLISHEAIYLYVWADKRSGGGLYKYLIKGQVSGSLTKRKTRKTTDIIPYLSYKHLFIIACNWPLSLVSFCFRIRTSCVMKLTER